jgi:NAD(P)-dependent dehydrogenase (short-subunit alcohol dehydrogenase family)
MQANSPTSKLSGKIALVTGGTSGIGLATTKKFVAWSSLSRKPGRSKGGAERMVPPPSQAAMGSRQTSENELKVRAIDVGESLKSPPNRIDKAV